MPQINIQRDPSAITKIERHYIDGQVNLLDWLIENEEVNFSNLHASINLNGKPIVQTWEGSPEQHNKAIDINIGCFDSVDIIIRPKGIDPFTIAIIAVAVVATAAVAIALAPKPSIPTSITDGTDSSASNNQLNAAKNSYRPRQAIPDIAGQVVSYPDFAQLSYYEYQNNDRVFREIFVVGVGQHTISDVKIGEDSLTDITGNEYTVRYDDTPPNLLNVRPNANSQEVDILAPDINESTIIVSGEGRIDTSDNRINLSASLMEQLGVNIGDSVELAFYYEIGGGDPDIYVETTTTVLAVSLASFTVAYSFAFNGTRLDGYIRKVDGSSGEKWYTLEGDSIEEVWLDLKMPSGIKNEDGGYTTITATLTIEALDASGNPTGVTYDRGCVFAGNTRSALYQTFKLTQEDGIGISGFRAKIERLTNSLGDNSIDLLTMESVKAVTPYTADFGKVTTLDVTRKSNARVARGQSDKLNCLATRKLRIYDHINDVYGSTYEETRRFCDYAFYLLYEVAGVALEDIDTDSLFGIYDNLSDAQLGYFDGTFDDKNTSLRDRMEIICNNSRVRYWNVGLKWFFVREEQKGISTMMFNRRNLKREQRFIQGFRRPSDYDGVTVSYVDPDTNSESRIYRSINDAGAIINTEGSNSLEFTMTLGCRNEAQATNRAELEIRRLIYQSVKVTDTALSESLEMQIGERVDYVDIYDGDTFDGEVLGVDGDNYTTSERFEPESGIDYYVYITDDNGNISNSVRAYPLGSGDIYGFKASGLAGAYLSGGFAQVGSRYVIASNEDLEAQSYIAIGRGRPNEQGECSIELAEYNDLMFEAD